MSKPFGSFFTTLGGLFGLFCPACVPAVAGLLTTIGLGFLANFVVSRVLLLIFLSLALIALHVSALWHRRHGAFVVGLFAAMGMIAGRNFYLNTWLIYFSSMGLFVAALLDYIYRRRSQPACPVK